VIDKLVITPGGYRPRSMVHQIECEHVIDSSAGTFRQIDSLGRILADHGPVHSHPDGFPLMPANVVTLEKARALKVGQLRDAPAVAVAATAVENAELGTGWIVYASWTKSGSLPVTFFTTEWVVPPAPSTGSKQLIYLFNGIQSPGRILQPVLQWGESPAGGGTYWAVASWYVGDVHEPCFHSPLVRVKEGDKLVGVITLTRNKGGKFGYESRFEGTAGTALQIDQADEMKECVEALEAYRINQASDYPATRKTSMMAIEVRVGEQEAALDWAPKNIVTDTGQHAIIFRNGSPGGEVALWYMGISTSAGAIVVSEAPCVVGQGVNGNLWRICWEGQWRWHNDGAPPTHIESEVLTTPLGAITLQEWRPCAFALSSLGNLWVLVKDLGQGWRWYNRATPRFGTKIDMGMGAITVQEGRPYVFVRCNDGHLWMNAWGLDSQWHWEDLGKPTDTVGIAKSMGAIAGQWTRPYVFVLGTDGHLWQKYWGLDQQWHWEDLGKPTATVEIAESMGAISVQEGRPYVFVLGTDGHLWQKYWGLDQQWHWEDLGKPTDTVGIAKSMGAISVQEGRPYVFALDTTGRLWLKYWGLDGQWHWDDVGA